MENEELKKQQEEVVDENEEQATQVDEVTTATPVEEPTEPKDTTANKEENEKAEEVEHAEEKEKSVEEEVKEEVEEEVAEVKEEVEEVKEEVEEAKEVDEPSIEELKAKIQEMEEAERVRKEEEEEDRQVAELRRESQKEEQELLEYQQGIVDTFKEQATKFGIPLDKPIDEIRKTDPAKGEILDNLIKVAQQLKDEAVAKATQKIEAKAKDLVFKKAAALIDKVTMTEEQKDIAIQTFVNVVKQVGVNDLKEDLIEKVNLAIANAKYIIPDVHVEANVKVDVEKKEIPTVEVDITNQEPSTEISEPVAEEVVAEPSGDTPLETVEEVNEPKIELDEFKEGISGTSMGATGSVTESNVMQKLNTLPFKERTAFYKEHADMINKACKKNFEQKRGI